MFIFFKGQLISKANCQAKNSSKKRTNEFVFTSMRRVFVCFLEESLARKKTFRDYLTFSGKFLVTIKRHLMREQSELHITCVRGFLHNLYSFEPSLHSGSKWLKPAKNNFT